MRTHRERELKDNSINIRLLSLFNLNWKGDGLADEQSTCNGWAAELHLDELVKKVWSRRGAEGVAVIGS
jgi:hypothetical protein